MSNVISNVISNVMSNVMSVVISNVMSDRKLALFRREPAARISLQTQRKRELPSKSL